VDVAADYRELSFYRGCVNVDVEVKWRGEVVYGGNRCSELVELSASLLLPGRAKHVARAFLSYVIPKSTMNLARGASQSPPLFNLSLTFCVMATSPRFVSSLRRSALSTRPAPRIQCLRLAPQVRRITSATSEPHQPDSKGGLDGPAPAKTIKFTSESYVATTGNNINLQDLTPADILKSKEIRNLPSSQKSM
jgi:hypothetical protein